MDTENINKCNSEHEFKSFKKQTTKPQESMMEGMMKGPEKTKYEIRCKKCGLPVEEMMKKDNHE